MIYVKDSGFPAGTIVVAAAMQPRFYEFSMSMERLKVPEGTRYFLARGCDITMNFNDGVKRASGDWIWFMGDDHGFPDDILLNLLARNVDVVVPPTPCKTYPFLPCIMHGSGSLATWNPSMPLYTWDELSLPGMFPLPAGDFIGQAGMLIKKKVLDQWEPPWFRAGQQDPGKLQEDMTFCRELQQRGHTIWIDCDNPIDHYYVMGISVRRHGNNYVPALLNGAETIVLPDAIAQRTEDGRTCPPTDKMFSGRGAPPPSRIKWMETFDA